MSAVGPVLVLGRSALPGTGAPPALLGHLTHAVRAAARPHAPVPLGGERKHLPVLALVCCLATIAVMYHSRFSGINKHYFHQNKGVSKKRKWSGSVLWHFAYHGYAFSGS